MKRYVIIGCGNAGIRAAIKIRQLEPEGRITIITDEPYPPYCRCLLTYYIEDKIEKSFLFEEGKRIIKYLDANFVDGLKVTYINVEKRLIFLSNGKEIRYDKLFIATGGTPAVPSFSYPENINLFTLRKFDDAVRIKETFKKGDTAIMEGGGLVSLKTLLALYKKGIMIKWITKSPYILSYVIDYESASFIENIINEKDGIEIIKNDSIVDVIPKGDNLIAKTQKGAEFEGKGIVVGKGVSPFPIESSKEIAFSGGYLVNKFLQTSQKDIYAAGDCIITYDIAHERDWRIPLWPLAGEQGICAASNMVKGNVTPYHGGIPVNSFSVFNHHIIAGGKKKIEAGEEKDYECKSYIDMENYILRRFIFKNNKLKGYVLVNDILKAGQYRAEIFKQEPANERNID